MIRMVDARARPASGAVPRCPTTPSRPGRRAVRRRARRAPERRGSVSACPRQRVGVRQVKSWPTFLSIHRTQSVFVPVPALARGGNGADRPHVCPRSVGNSPRLSTGHRQVSATRPQGAAHSLSSTRLDARPKAPTVQERGRARAPRGPEMSVPQSTYVRTMTMGKR